MLEHAINRNIEFMKSVDISGTWISEGGLVYLVTQVEDLFVWQVVHKNGITETGIGRFRTPNDITSLGVEAKWNFHGGELSEAVNASLGKVIMEPGQSRAIQIKWDVRDHFKRIDDAVR